MTVVDFKKVKKAKLGRDLQKLAAEFDANREAELWAALSIGFKFPQVGKDRWGSPTYAVLYRGKVIVDCSAEVDLDEALGLVDELLDHCASPAEYQEHAGGFVEAIAEHHAEADTEIEADLDAELADE